MADLLVHVEKDKKKSQFKIIVIGDAAVGKTSLIKKYVKVKIEDDYMPTIGSQICKQPVKLKVGDQVKDVSLMIWDIAGQKKFNLLHKVYYEGSRGIVMVFDLTRIESFNSIKMWYAEVTKFGLTKVPIILVGNKCDLTDKIKINQGQIDMFKMMFNIPDYFETSALDGRNVNEMFYNMAEQIYPMMNKTA